jgi:thiol-disulfide isomerase/thioredoxin
MRAEPIVKRLQKEWVGSVQVLQVNINDREGKAFLDGLGVRFTPTFVLFDDEGQEVWRSVGQINAGEVKEQVAALQEA